MPVFWIVIGIFWWKRRKLKQMASSLPNGPHFVEQQERMNADGIVKAGISFIIHENTT